MRYQPYLQPAVNQSAPNGRRRPSATRRQSFAERRNLWRDDAFDPRVVGVVVGPDGCAHAGADIREPVRA